jgi:hypothetical protein
VRNMRIGATLLVAIAALFIAGSILTVVLVNRIMDQHALTEAGHKARLLLDQYLSVHAYFSHRLKPTLFKQLADTMDEADFEPVWMSSTYAVRAMHALFAELTEVDYYYKECAINARSPANEADAFEAAFLAELNGNPDLTVRSAVRSFDGKPYFTLLRRGETMEGSCLRCHDKPELAPAALVEEYGDKHSFGRREGEVVSAISIRIPVAQAFEDADRFSMRLSGLLLVMLLAVCLALVWITRRIILQPLAVVRERAEAIAQSPIAVGDTIQLPRGRELADLTSAFNRMSVSLKESHDHLEERVEKRTAQLKEAHRQVNKLEGLLPICAWCKKIRDDEGEWTQMETYVSKHSDAQFTHGLCPSCMKRMHPDGSFDQTPEHS